MPPSERLRADAARNRTALLRAVEELLTHHHPAQISMEQVAIAAGVGKGTVFHRFGSRDGLMRALVQERAHDLNVTVDQGPPPLGPGAPPRTRLLAFLSAVVDLVARNKGLLAALGPAAGPIDQEPREAHPVYRRWHGHVAELAGQERPDLDADLLAHVLLAPLHSEPILDQLAREGGDRLTSTLHQLVTALLPAEASHPTETEASHPTETEASHPTETKASHPTETEESGHRA
ncbi:TetR family transcriptional regulator [Actinoplanes ianthinogenes]|uniref:TetR family transcriptional regulator n=1 Tax=Actinoplanes ianthinogenes TaxID=122358 RepID=A0ABM7M5J9_9ACTN|nr:TetR/AcrR family transcriptional regulator [Actinoplanes ianthinogenes]BCJ46876.1 TetR family transcriptional regulator [Actinoplanes ianthinogenes]GGR14908.1 TetR family transcriptional regulator [Actinoplanes ianthinogenes]